MNQNTGEKVYEEARLIADGDRATKAELRQALREVLAAADRHQRALLKAAQLMYDIGREDERNKPRPPPQPGRRRLHAVRRAA